MIICGIETSCDETSVALLENGQRILGLKTYSQIKKHRPFGGVVPEIASRMHLSILNPLLKELFDESKLKLKDIDAIAVTHCPGLIGSLLVGVSYANGLALSLEKPIVGINHTEAHIYASFIDHEKVPKLPALALVVSGGHTLLIHMKAIGDYELLGSTLDDAVGEAFDKVAKILGLPYPGGPEIDKRSALGNEKAFEFPKAMLKDKDNLDFSFSGLKTSVLYKFNDLRKQGELSDDLVSDIAASFQKAVVDVLRIKIERALKKVHAKSLIVCGGVAANRGLKKSMTELSQNFSIDLFMPEISLCIDNAAMVAGLAYHKQHEFQSVIQEVKSNALIGV